VSSWIYGTRLITFYASTDEPEEKEGRGLEAPPKRRRVGPKSQEKERRATVDALGAVPLSLETQASAAT